MKNRFSTASETSYTGRLAQAIETGDIDYLTDNVARHVVSYDDLAALEALAEQSPHAEAVKDLLERERAKWISVSDNEDNSYWLPRPEHRAIALEESTQGPGNSDTASHINPPSL